LLPQCLQYVIPQLLVPHERLLLILNQLHNQCLESLDRLSNQARIVLVNLSEPTHQRLLHLQHAQGYRRALIFDLSTLLAI
jgi:hypothetical protein